MVIEQQAWAVSAEAEPGNVDWGQLGGLLCPVPERREHSRSIQCLQSAHLSGHTWMTQSLA